MEDAKKKRRPGGGRKPLTAEERLSRGPARGPAVSIRATPMDVARLRTVAPPGVSLGAWMRDHCLAHVESLWERSMETALEIVHRLDGYDPDQIEISCDDGSPAVQAIALIREAVRLGDRRKLPPTTVRVRVGSWTGILPGLAELLLPDAPGL